MSSVLLVFDFFFHSVQTHTPHNASTIAGKFQVWITVVDFAKHNSILI